MGNLKPGATYTYRYDKGTVYAQDAKTLSEEAIGWEYDPKTNGNSLAREQIIDAKLWGEIRRAAKENPALQTALDRVIILYQLGKDHGK